MHGLSQTFNVQLYHQRRHMYVLDSASSSVRRFNSTVESPRFVGQDLELMPIAGACMLSTSPQLADRVFR